MSGARVPIVEQTVLVTGVVAMAVALVIMRAGAVIDWVLRHRR